MAKSRKQREALELKIAFATARCVYENDYIVVFDVSGVLPKRKKDHYTLRDTRRIDRVVYHHSAGQIHPPPTGLVEMTNFIIRSQWLGGRGWPGNPYHIYVPYLTEQMTDGRFVIYMVQPFMMRTYHTLVKPRFIKSMTGFNRPGACNDLGVSVCFQGSFNKTREPSDAQKACVLPVWNWLRDEFDLMPTDLWGHYHYGKKACPGPWLQNVIEQVRRGDLA